MSNRQPQFQNLTENYASFSIEDDDEEGLLFEAGEDGLAEIDDRWLLVGRFLTNRSIDFQAMQNKIASLWQPGRGLGEERGSAISSKLTFGFNATLQQCNLVDIELQGHPFTWEKGRGSNNWIEIRLDRALATLAWLQPFSLNRIFPLFLLLTIVFRFEIENTWLKEPLCSEIIKECWELGHSFSFSGKLSLCAEKLKVWGKEITGSLNHRIKGYKKELKNLQNKREIVLVQGYQEVKKKLFKALDQRESYWKQRAKQFWLREGDQNSNYFHKAGSSRKKNNQIEQLKDAQGNWVTWESSLGEVMKDYFHNLFTSSNTNCMEVVDCVHPCVSAFVNSELCQPIQEEEAYVVSDASSDKSPVRLTDSGYRCWSIMQ
uniref:DUF4283 domain-containing protein n=1 Tax=Cannabis sativa TaxID=3483 RepID=A0A803PA88_CANSA